MILGRAAQKCAGGKVREYGWPVNALTGKFCTADLTKPGGVTGHDPGSQIHRILDW